MSNFRFACTKEFNYSVKPDYKNSKVCKVQAKQMYGNLRNGRRSGGLLRRLGEKKIAENVVMVSTEQIGRLEEVLNRFDVSYSEFNGWLCV